MGAGGEASSGLLQGQITMAVKNIVLTDVQLREVVKEAVVETLTSLGIEADNPLEAQKDFQHLRDWRIQMEKVRNRSLLTATGIAIAGIVAVLMVGFKRALTGE